VKLYVAEIFRAFQLMRPPRTRLPCRGTSCTCPDVVRTAYTLCFDIATTATVTILRDRVPLPPAVQLRRSHQPGRRGPGRSHDEEQLADVREQKAAIPTSSATT
jgi:hypothetical protein